ncbi:MAG: sigma-54-dependent Fis family transcriptional regulator [Gammaproteobacteria bacterium]|nr:sigma-54-dependent Fis family transcriptional regulator [Gammaproteobacteria bacterium]
MSKQHILVVDDEPDIRELIRDILIDEGFEVSVADCANQANEARRSRRPDLVLLDIWMPDLDGISLLKQWCDEGELSFPVIMISGHGNIETAVEATRLGAYDFLEKPLSMAKLLLTVQRALDSAKLQRENVNLRRQTVIEPIGRSKTLRALREQAQRIGKTDARVLVTGEPGTGKAVFARYIHQHSSRSGSPFVDVGVTSIANENAAVELFGREEGEQIYYGLLEQANGGTLLLTEIAEMDLSMQAKLIGAIESQSLLRVGGSEPVQFDVRIITANLSDLGEAVAKQRFREDLYYQLNVLPLHIPPLRDHPEDVSELLEYYVEHFVVSEGLSYRGFNTAAQNRLRNYGWPGNVRELKNLVQRLLILGGRGDVELQEVDLALGAVTVAASTESPVDFNLPLREARERFEKAYLEHQLELTKGSVGKLAQRTGMERTHLYRKMRALGINIKRGSAGDA